MAYVVDTNIINWLVDGHIDIRQLPQDDELIVSHIQRDEINNTKDDDRRDALNQMFARVIDDIEPTESVVAGVSRVGLAKVSDGVLFESLREALNSANKGKSNNTHDALIAEIAINNDFTLITADQDLNDITLEHGGTVKFFDR